jgi:hypothetical protein
MYRIRLPFVDLDKVRVTVWNPDAQTRAGTGSFQIDREFEQAGGRQPRRLYPMFLDPFGSPILYWRADPAGSQMVDNNDTGDPLRLTGPDRVTKRGVYHWIDNAALLGDDDDPMNNTRLRTPEADAPHKLIWDDPPDPQGYTYGPPEVLPRVGTFANYIMNKDNKSRVQPRKHDSFLLVSPGPDGVYGTSDDIANFQFNGVQ